MGAVVSGILNSYERFAVPSLAPLAYNLVIILAAIFLAPIMGVEGLAVGVAIGSLGPSRHPAAGSSARWGSATT